MKPTMSSAAEASRITVYFPCRNLRRIRGVDRLLRRNFGQPKRIKIAYVGEFDFCHPEESEASMVNGKPPPGFVVCQWLRPRELNMPSTDSELENYSRGREFVRLRTATIFFTPAARSCGVMAAV